MNDSRRSAWASSCRTDMPGYFGATAPTIAGVIECSPPSTKMNLSRLTISAATLRISPTTSSIVPNGNSISGKVKMPMLCTSVWVSSSQSSMCDEATSISCGPLRVPGIYDVVRSSGIGRMTTRACSKSVVVGVVPPYSPTLSCSYSNGRLIHFLEAFAGNGQAVDRHDAPVQRERGPDARREQWTGAGRECRREQGQYDRGVGLDRHLQGIAGQLAPALRLLETRPRRATEVRHVGDDLERVAVAANPVAVELGLNTRLVDEILRCAAAEHHRRGPRPPDDEVRRLDDVADG